MKGEGKGEGGEGRAAGRAEKPMEESLTDGNCVTR